MANRIYFGERWKPALDARHVRLTRTQISLHIRTVWTVLLVRMKKLCILGYPKCAQLRFWSDCANPEAYQYLNVCWVHMIRVRIMSADALAHVISHTARMCISPATICLVTTTFLMQIWHTLNNSVQSCTDMLLSLYKAYRIIPYKRSKKQHLTTLLFLIIHLFHF